MHCKCKCSEGDEAGCWVRAGGGGAAEVSPGNSRWSAAQLSAATSSVTGSQVLGPTQQLDTRDIGVSSETNGKVNRLK